MLISCSNRQDFSGRLAGATVVPDPCTSSEVTVGLSNGAETLPTHFSSKRTKVDAQSGTIESTGTAPVLQPPLPRLESSRDFVTAL